MLYRVHREYIDFVNSTITKTRKKREKQVVEQIDLLLRTLYFCVPHSHQLYNNNNNHNNHNNNETRWR